jgi:hypothetical protein
MNRLLDWLDRADQTMTRLLAIRNGNEAAGCIVLAAAVALCAATSAAAIIVRVAVMQLPR